jgi:hypothetical protein
MICAFTVPALASAKLPAASEGFAFHCNDIEDGGNGKTYIVGKDKDYGKFDKKTGEGLIQLAPALGDTTGKIWVPVEDLGVCTSCGRSDWVSFSNKSGTPDGKNIQLQHPGPSKRYITIQVIYNLDVPACDFTCVNADAMCEFECTCDPCPWEAEYPGHTPCDNDCGVGHDCIFDDPDLDLACATVCDCEKSISQIIVNQKVLIVIADGYLFKHTAPETWMGGDYVSGPKVIIDLLFNSKTYNVYYEGYGDCACECDLVVCEAECLYHGEPSGGDNGCDHEWLCDSCNGYWHNHCQHDNRCSDGDNPNDGNYNYFCAFCGEKNPDGGWKVGDDGRPICYATSGACAWTGEGPCPNCD